MGGWVVGRESWVVGRGWVGHGSWVMSRESWVVDHASKIPIRN